MAKDAEERQGQLIEAALRVFSRKGFGKATIKDVAQEAGITPGLIYYYFESKEALLRAIFEHYTPVRSFEPLSPQAMTLPPAVFLQTFFTQILMLKEDEHLVGFFRVMLSELLHGETPSVSQFVSTLLERVLTVLSGYLETKMAAGELRRADSLFGAQMVLSMLIGIALRRVLLQDPFTIHSTPEQLATLMVDTFMQGFASR